MWRCGLCFCLLACVADKPRQRGGTTEDSTVSQTSTAAGTTETTPTTGTTSTTPTTGTPTTTSTGVLPPLPAPAPAACTGSGATVFADVTACAGISAAIHIIPGDAIGDQQWTTGQVWLDVDGDDWLDLLTTSLNGWNRLFLGASDGTFTERSVDEMWEHPAISAVQADFDQDGDPDLFLVGTDTDALFVNDNGVFVESAGPSDPRNTLTASVSDADGDGQLELWLTNYSCQTCSNNYDCDGTTDGWWVQGPTGWTEDTASAFDAGMTCGLGFVGTWADFDNDGDTDLYVVNDKGSPQPDYPGNWTFRNTFWRNDGPGCGSACFTEIARSNGTEGFMNGMGADSGDFDNDGDLDMAVTDEGTAKVFENDGAGNFTEVGPAIGVDAMTGADGWGILWLDYDNDGDLDLYWAATGQDWFYRNDGGTFVDDTAAVVGLDSMATRSAALHDYDRDGRVDIVTGAMGGAYRLLRNEHPNTNHWLGLRLVGSGAGGTDALGARVLVTDTSGRVQLREVKSGSSLGAGSDLGVHFGLGSEQLTEVRVRWPDGVEVLVDVQIDAWTVVTR